MSALAQALEHNPDPAGLKLALATECQRTTAPTTSFSRVMACSIEGVCPAKRSLAYPSSLPSPLHPSSTEPTPFRASFHQKICPSCPFPPRMLSSTQDRTSVSIYNEHLAQGLALKGADKCWVLGRSAGRRQHGRGEGGL